MRILAISDVAVESGIIGGSSRVVHGVGHGLAERGHEVFLLTQGWGSLPASEEAGLVRIRRYPVNRSTVLERFAGTWSGLPRALREIPQPLDVVLLHHPLSGFVYNRLCSLEGVPQIYTFHSPWHLELESRSSFLLCGHRNPAMWPIAFLCRMMERVAVLGAKRVLTLSQYMKDLCLKAHPELPPSRVTVIPGGVDCGSFAPCSDIRVRQEARKAQFGVSDSTVVFLTVRDLIPRMGLEVLLNALGKVQSILSDWLCLIAGDGPLRQALEKRAVEMGLEERVKFLGFVPEERLVALYQMSDCFLLPTKELEGFGMVILEAMACGLPVLGSPVGAIPEVLGRFDEGFLLSGADDSALARGILSRLDRGHSDRDLALSCRRFAEHFSWPVIVEIVEETILEVISDSHT